mmetsp:Transcript_1051/g.1331  ORF Transcript_1051/g.1331 Transcript_1051/m.1331 type:complete len:356 (+) Transcript_1051:182-1249(+)|eukprot:CAMPEP_0204841962 /NCGR_PEP_ID=MMETSP1346-20131115/44326_1 /ASSEMBLY_ACC=CAM_ASM_000771 /TAXON_ID=215587 /ORGANISM="Aplanochytrium stocchinoi, Strain GSBS06" /LENGTH=355 /DNA_ID=CAMNT_0051980473 /DNA_START=167 /DNA_END=1234 /DNA_ORIENTATION=+
MGDIVQNALSTLIKGDSLSGEQTTAIMETIASGNAEAVQTGAFLVLLAAKGETIAEVKSMVEVMRKYAINVSIPYKVVDIVGTGGDGFNTVNISTSAAILSAACGAKVAKHGSTSVSSKSGSSDVLEKLGVAMCDPTTIAECIDKAGIGFMFAPKFHPAMKYVVPVRKALKVRTVFNIMGPLLNPAGAQRLMLGVYKPELLELYGNVLHGLGVEHALVVHGSGMDELNTLGPVQAVEVTPEKGVQKLTIDPLELGLAKGTLQDLQGGDAEENAAIIRKVFSGGENAKGTLAETIALNAAAVLYVYGMANSIKEGYEIAMTKLQEGSALNKLDEFVSISTSLNSEEPAESKRAKTE